MLHVVCGAPCAGKTTYVGQNAKEGDLIIDADKIANAFGGDSHQAKGEPFKVALKAREVAISHALNSKEDTWLIDTLPTAEKLDTYKKANAEIVFLNTDKAECLKRAEKRPKGTAEAIEKFYNNTEALQNLQHSLGGKHMETEILTNQDVTTQNASTSATIDPKTFTQDDVNRIVAKRVAKYADYEELKQKAAKFDEQVEAGKSDLQKATEKANSLQAELDALKQAESLRIMREEVADAKGIPAKLLTGKTAEECEAQAAELIAWAQKTSSGYPKVPDGGDPISSKPAREQFADWLNNQI